MKSSQNSEKFTFSSDTKEGKDANVKMLKDLVDQYHARTNSLLRNPKGLDSPKLREKPMVADRASVYVESSQTVQVIPLTSVTKIPGSGMPEKKSNGSLASTPARNSNKGSTDNLPPSKDVEKPLVSSIASKFDSNVDEKPVKPGPIPNESKAVLSRHASSEKLSKHGSREKLRGSKDSLLQRDEQDDSSSKKGNEKAEKSSSLKSLESTSLTKSKSRERLDQLAQKSNLKKSSSVDNVNEKITEKTTLSRASSKRGSISNGLKRSASSKDRLSSIGKSNSSTSIGPASDIIPIPNAISTSNEKINGSIVPSVATSRVSSAKSSRRSSRNNLDIMVKDETKRSGLVREPSHGIFESSIAQAR